MQRIMVSLALVIETGFVIATGYVLYRWQMANRWPGTPLNPPNPPYWGSFESVVAPWIFAALFIPACFVVLTVARRFRQI
jgi:hypothetical protein